MAYLLLSLALFMALHSVPAIPAIRSHLIEKLGRAAYFTLYSVASTATLVLVFLAVFRLDYVPIWDKAPWQAWVTMVMAPLGLFLVVAGLVSRNPFSVTLRRETREIGAIATVTRHPVPVGFALWAFGHMVPNGDLRSVVLFGIFGLFSLGGVAMQERRAKKRLGAAFAERAAGTSILPFAAWIDGRAKPRLDHALLSGLALSLTLIAAILGGLHVMLIGVDPLVLAIAF